jgi:hypoxanthine phosphoribosyltransferase
MTASTRYEVLTWTQIYNLLLNQGQRISCSAFKPDVIVGVSRGGWFPARILSDILENSNLANVKAECYVGIDKSRKMANLTQCVSADVLGKRVLVVDEIVDSGRSLQLVVSHLMQRGAREVKTATMFCKPRSAFKPDYCETEHWVVFPWETKETVRDVYESHKIDASQAQKEFSALAAAGMSKRLITRFLREFSEEKIC